MDVLCRMLMLAAAGLLAGLPARADDRPACLRVLPPVRRDAAAMPLITDPADDAEHRINTALHRLDARLRKAIAACKADDGIPAYWQRTVEAPMRGPGCLSIVITDDA